MSRERKERQRIRRAGSIPPAEFLGQAARFREIEEVGVAEWCPTPDGSGPAEAVVLHFRIRGEDEDLGLRLKSPGAVNRLIAMLERHRDSVWPGLE